MHKNGYIFEARLLVKVVPKVNVPPYLMAIVRATDPDYEFFLLDMNYVIRGVSHRIQKELLMHNN